MTTANVIKNRLRLSEAANSLLVYYWTGEDYHLESARGNLMEALSEGNDPADVQRIIDNALPLPPTEE